MHRWQPALALAFLATGAIVAPAHAQETDPRAVLEASAEAIREVPGFSAQFRMAGDGSDLIKSTMPSMNGRLVFGRTGDGPAIHIMGEYRDSANGASQGFDVVRTREKILWTDDAKQTVFVRRAQPEPRDMPTPARLLHLTSLLDDEPFAAALQAAESVTHEGVETVAGQACDVVLIAFPKDARSRVRGGPSHSAEKWFLAQSDRLPRRIDQITDAGMLKYSLNTELSNLSVGPQEPADLDVRRPESYKVDDATVPREAPTPAAQPPARPEPRPAAPEPTPARPAAPTAPAFSFTPDGSPEPVTNATQAGRVTVLYFWGTWCIPCRAVSPEISKMVEDFAGRPVDVFAPAIRERDPEAPRSYLAQNDYAHRLVLGAENLAGAFRVRVYPTVVVIGPDGRIVFDAHPSAQRTPAQLAEQARDAVEAALASD